MILNALRGGGKTILNALRVALRIFSGKIIFISRLSRPAGRSKRIFTSGVAEGNSICGLKGLFYQYDSFL